MNLLFIGTQELIVLLPLLILFFYTAYHAITNRNLTVYQRSLWILVIVLGNLLGWILYWAIGKNRSGKQNKQTQP